MPNLNRETPRQAAGNVAAFNRAGIWVGLITLITVPSIVGASKAATNVFCPSEIRRYGGDVP